MLFINIAVYILFTTDYAVGVRYENLVSTKWFVATLYSSVMNVSNVNTFCIDMKILLLSAIKIKINYITVTGQLIKDKEIFTRNKPMGKNWVQWSMEVKKPPKAVRTVFKFEFRIRKDGSGVAALIDKLNILFGSCADINHLLNNTKPVTEGWCLQV